MKRLAPDIIFLPLILLLSIALPLSIKAQSKQSSGIVTLTGYKVVPEVPTAASGTVIVTLRNDSLFFNGSFKGLSGKFTAAYIHYGKKNENGNKLFELDPQLSEDKTEGSFNPDKNYISLNEVQLEALGKGLLYMVIYSNEYRKGEIRGQIPQLKPQ